MKILRTDVVFDASAKTITFTDAVELERLMLITNVTDNVIIYNFADSAKGGTIATTVLTLTFDTTTMADTDELQVWYWSTDKEPIGYVEGNTPINPEGVLAMYIDSGTGEAKTITAGQPLPVTLGSNVVIDASTSNLAVESGGFIQNIDTTLLSVDSKIPVLGQALSASSTPVVLASDQSSIGVSVTNFPLSFGVSVTNFPSTYTILPGASLTFGLNVNPTIANSSFGVSVSNFPALYTIIPGASLNVGLIGGLSINNSGFGVSVSNLVNVGVTNVVTVRHSIDSLMNGVTSISPNFKDISAGSSGDNTIISPVAGRNIRVLQYSLTVGVSNNIKWSNGVSNLSGVMPFGSPGGIANPYTPIGLFETGISRPLLLNLAAGGSIAGHLTYVLV